MEDYRSPLTRVLSGVSWEGRKVNTKYRDGGRGVEEVLTAEVFQALEFLPRHPFIEEVAKKIIRLGEEKEPFIEPDYIETVTFEVSPGGGLSLRPSGKTHQERVEVQFDALITTSRCDIYVEAKRLGRSSFQEEQLARTFLIALRESRNRSGKVLLILGEPPPVLIKKMGRQSIENGILETLPVVYEKTEGIDASLQEVESRISDTVAYITWEDIAIAVTKAMERYENHDPSTSAAVKRIAKSLVQSIRWHQAG